MQSMIKTAKKLTLNKEKLRVLTDTNLERVAGGYINSTGSDWCSSSAYLKCGGSDTRSQFCANP